jgi:transmembrane sensor
MSLTDAEFSKIIAHAFGEDVPGVEAILAGNPEARAVLEEIQALRGSGERLGAGAGVDTQAALARVKGADATAAGNTRTGIYSRGALLRWVGYAAMAATIGIVAVRQIPVVNKTAPVTHTYATTNAQRANVVLLNQVQVHLAPASSIRVSGTTVTLTGHAVFTVKHKTNDPFTVIANGVATRVLGTTFSVRAYPGEGHTRVAVREGRVSVQPATVTSLSTVVLNANEGVFVENDGRIRVANGAAIDDFAAVEGRLVLREAPLGEALLELSRWYGLDFRAADSSLLTRQITTTTPEVITNDVLQEIAAALDARVVRNGNTVTFEKK